MCVRVWLQLHSPPPHPPLHSPHPSKAVVWLCTTFWTGVRSVQGLVKLAKFLAEFLLEIFCMLSFQFQELFYFEHYEVGSVTKKGGAVCSSVQLEMQWFYWW